MTEPLFLPATLKREGWPRKVAALARWRAHESIYAPLMRGYALQVAAAHGVSVDAATAALREMEDAPTFG